MGENYLARLADKQDWQINMWQSYKFPVRLAAFAMSKILQKLSGILAR